MELVCIVRDQEVGGSNPLAPTTFEMVPFFFSHACEKHPKYKGLQLIIGWCKEANIRAVQNPFRKEGTLNRELVS